MTFTVEDFHDLIRLLEQHPEWRAELRRYVLTDDVLGLPAALRELADAQRRTEQLVAELVEAQKRTDERLAELHARVDQRFAELAEFEARVDQRFVEIAEFQARTDQRFAEIAEFQARADQRFAELAEAEVRTDQRFAELAEAQARTDQRLGDLTDRVGDLDGRTLEQRYAQRAGAYFGRLARKARVVDSSRLADLLRDAVGQGRLTDAERDAVLDADLVVSGQRQDDDAQVYYVVEVSVGVAVDDVRRAAERAAILAKLGRPAVPVVAGKRISAEASAAAAAFGVWRMLDGRATAPSGA